MARLIKIGEYANQSEKWAAEYLKTKLSDDYLILTNVDVYNDSGFRLECDQIIIGVHAVYVIEVKGFTGRIRAGKNLWTFDTGHNPMSSPVTATRTKAIQLRSRMKRRITSAHLHAPWTQHAIFVTGDRGGRVELAVDHPEDCIGDPETILDLLTNPKRLVCERYHGPLSADQIDLAEREIEQLEQLRRLPIRFGSFTDIKQLGNDYPYALSRGVLRIGGHERQFLLRVLEKSVGSDYREYEGWLNQLIEEASLYHELSSVPGVPYVAPLDEDDERVVFAISMPPGKPLAGLESRTLPFERKLGILRAVASTLSGVHGRGMVHGRLDPRWIYVTDGGEIQILNFSAAIGGECPYPPPEAAEDGFGVPGDVYAMARIFAPWFGTLATDGSFEAEISLKDSERPIVDWFRSALAPDPEERPLVSDLLKTLRRMELGLVATPIASEDPFRREPGALLHGTFRLEDSLGSGPAGEVWRARHDRGNYPLALYFPEHGEEEFLRGRFEEIAGLHHPMIVRAYDLRRVPGEDAMYMAVDWQDGDPLDQILENEERPDQATILGWLRDALIALEFIHGQGVLHRNISPDAIVIVQGRPRLVEFSLLPESERHAGLIEYTDPRVSETGWRGEADLYALAATFLNLLAGITPRTPRGSVLDVVQIEKALPSGFPVEVRKGLIEVLSPGFELQTNRYAELFGVQEPPKVLDKLPDEFLRQWGLSLTGHQERIARFMIQEFHGVNGGRARSRNAVSRGSLKLTDVRANKTLRNSANAAISTLVSKGVLYSPPGTKAVRPTESFLNSWGEYSTAAN